ncbi:hypothetical protein D3C76_639540 [compost metagenome]
MIHFPALRAKRFTAHLKELSMMDAITLASMPDHLGEESTTFFLRAAVAEASGIADPAQWTVQERTLAVCHYMASTFDDGPDFSLGGNGSRYSDYLVGEKDYGVAEIDIGEIEGDKWVVRHLSGVMAGAIERLQGELPGVSGSTHWQIGLMAAQMVPNGEGGDPSKEGEYDAFLLERMQVIAHFPESVFARLLVGYERASLELEHLFRIGFDDAGLLVLPREGCVAELPPARFPASSCITSLARHLGGKPQADGA